MSKKNRRPVSDSNADTGRSPRQDRTRSTEARQATLNRKTARSLKYAAPSASSIGF